MSLSLEKFDRFLDRILEEELSCEGELAGVRIEKDISLIMRSHMSRGLIGYLRIYLKKPISPKEIEPFLEANESIKITYKKFLDEEEIPLDFSIIRSTKDSYENLLDIRNNRDYTTSTIYVVIKEDDRMRYIEPRSREIIRKILSS
jgi:hypothetical protein